MRSKTYDSDDFVQAAFDEIRDLLQTSKKWEESFDLFQDAFNREFPPSSRESHTAATLLWALFAPSVIMSSMGFSWVGIIESHSILEEYSRRELVQRISKKSSYEIMNDVLSEPSLMRLAQHLKTLGAISANDVGFSRKLSGFRNPMIHRNVKSMKQLIKVTEDVHPLTVWKEASKVDWIPYQIGCIRFMVHLSGWAFPED